MKFKVFVVLHVPYCNQHVLDSLFHPVVNEYRYFFLWRVGVFWKSTFKLSWCTFSQAIVLSLYIAKSCFITKYCKAEYSRVICYAKFKLVLILHTACCHCISINNMSYVNCDLMINEVASILRSFRSPPILYSLWSIV